MTVEIAIMNLGAVALATDSAVTAYPGGNQKVFSSQNKLFGLSDVAPIGILVYGNASFMSIPWETLIKEYRRRRGRNTFSKLNEYMTDFCRFLVDDISGYISPEQQADHAKLLVRLIYEEIATVIQQKKSSVQLGEPLINEEPSTTERVANLIDSLTEETIDEYLQRARAAHLVEGAPDDFLERIQKTLRRSFRNIREDIFKQKLKPSAVRKLNEIAARAVGALLEDVTVQSPRLTTGIVVAGFGDDDLFPALTEVHVEGLVEDVLKMRRVRERTLDPNNRARIIPFAQTEMIHQFMRGIAPDHLEYLHTALVSLLGNYTDRVLENLGQYSASDREELRERLRNVHPDIADSFVEWVEEVGNTYFAGPIVDVVAMLPKDQLAEMAEALVSLTSLKRKVSLEEETVGGPTDVALITKGDGLIWVKRKHYFPAELNPAYFARTYGRRQEHATGNA